MKARELVDRDKINNASKQTVARVMVRIFDRIQNLSPEEQVMGLAAAYLVMCGACGMPAGDVFTAVKNLMADPLAAKGIDKRFAAMEMHIQDDLIERL